MDRRHEPFRPDARALTGLHLPQVLELDWRSVGDTNRPESPEAVGPSERGRHERDSGRQRDASCTCVWTRHVLLDPPLFAPRALREDRHDLAVPGKPHSGLDRSLVALAPFDLERPAEAENWPERRVEELCFCHKPQLPFWKQGPAERPRVHIGEMVRREDIPTLARKVLLPRGSQAKEKLHRQPREDSDQDVRG